MPQRPDQQPTPTSSSTECAALKCADARNHRPRPDFFLADHGSISLLMPITQAAVAWVDEHLPADRTTWGDAVVIEHRFVPDVVRGIRAGGLVVR